MNKKIAPNTMSVLIVDDVKSMRSIMRSMLKNLKIGRVVHMAENGLEALKILHVNSIDLAIVDWNMPVMNGVQLLEAVRNNKTLRDIPVLMVTGESEKDIVLEVAEIEVEGYLLKPLTPAVLEEKIKTIVHHVNFPEEATLHVRKARHLEEKKDIVTAIKHMRRAIQLRPGASRLLRNLGLLYQKNGDEKSMEEYLINAVSVNVQDAVSRRILGDFYWNKNDFESAAHYYHEVIGMTRKFTDEAIALGHDLFKGKQSQKAKELFSGIIYQSPKNIDLIEKIVNICIQHDEWAYSLELLKRLIRDFPSNYDLIYQAGDVCERLNDVDAALEYYLVVDKQQFSRIDVKLKIAKIFIGKKKIIQADNYLNMVLKKDPGNEEAVTLRRLV